MVDGKRYALPVGVATLSMIANTDLLARYGVPLPDDATWSWDDLRAVGARVSQASGGRVAGVQAWGVDPGLVEVWARQAGGSLFTGKGVGVPQRVLTEYWRTSSTSPAAGSPPAPR